MNPNKDNEFSNKNIEFRRSFHQFKNSEDSMLDTLKSKFESEYNQNLSNHNRKMESNFRTTEEKYKKLPQSTVDYMSGFPRNPVFNYQQTKSNEFIKHDFSNLSNELELINREKIRLLQINQKRLF